ncbi:MAG: hypothetical protein A2W25_03075 [candidate division Zixibacteria bacterium RBG_16_53_22]|nr:MAG: hypothetical protein A2W25_03075 [candidate division Zixibacteria bacterium RBG_16_53_22]
MKKALSWAVVSSLLVSVACGIYTFSPSALGSVRSLAIPLFENETTESGIRERLTDQLAQAFVNDNTLKVVREQQADAIMHGSVVSYVLDPYSYSQAEVVSEYICRIGLNVTFVNRKTGKAIWEEKGMTNFGIYNPATETEEDGKARAVAKLVEDILNKTVKGW